MKRHIEIPRSAYPLAWPAGVPRTKHATRARFGAVVRRESSVTPGQYWSTKGDLTVAKAREHVLAELERLGAREPVIISTNMRTRLDGLPAGGQAEPQDSGVAVYFVLDKVETCLALDRYDRVADNLRAVAKTIEALRGIERWGGASLLKAAFQGFQGLPGPGESGGEGWWEVLGLAPTAPLGEIESRARQLSAEAHPDRGGDAARFRAIREALEAARAAHIPVGAV